MCRKRLVQGGILGQRKYAEAGLLWAWPLPLPAPGAHQLALQHIALRGLPLS